MKRLIALVFAAFIALPALGQRYTELKPPLPTESEGKVEVLEFFWYGCIHCYNLQPHIEAWLKKLPPDVQYRRVPTVFNARWALDATIFYTLEAMGLLEKLHKPLFDAIHKSRLRTDNQQELSEWLTKQGVDPTKFFEVSRSFGVQSRTKRATQLTAAYKIDGTPAMAVQGRYVVPADIPGMLKTVDELLAQVRKK